MENSHYKTSLHAMCVCCCRPVLLHDALSLLWDAAACIQREQLQQQEQAALQAVPPAGSGTSLELSPDCYPKPYRIFAVGYLREHFFAPFKTYCLLPALFSRGIAQLSCWLGRADALKASETDLRVMSKSPSRSNMKGIVA